MYYEVHEATYIYHIYAVYIEINAFLLATYIVVHVGYK